jgi:ketosteroid isomerase-like protein
MSDENVEKVRKGIDAFNRRDFDAALALLSDDVTWERFLSRAEAATPAVRGKDELLAVWQSQVEALDIRVEPEEFIVVGDKVIVPAQMVARGSGSEIMLTTSVTWVWTIDDHVGLATQVETFESRDDALRAAEGSLDG